MKKPILFFIGLFVTANLMAQSPEKFIDKANMNISVKPGDDFFEYANGVWIKNNPIPAKETRWGSFNELREFNSNAVKTILEEALKNIDQYEEGSVEKRVADFYAAGMDTLTIEKRGYDPIKKYLAEVDAINNLKGVVKEIALLKSYGLASPLYGFYVGQDRKNVEKMVPQLSQGGTSLPDRDYYLKTDARYLKAQEALKTYIKTLFTLTGTSEIQAGDYAENIFNLEKSLAEAQMARVEMRDPYKTYNKLVMSDFQSKTENIDWNAHFAAYGIPAQDSILVNSPNFFERANEILSNTSVTIWKQYLKWNVLKNSASLLSRDFVDASFTYSSALSGQQVETPRWQKLSSWTDGSIGELLGQLYVKRYFKPEAKARMDELVENLRKAFEIRINNLEWMGPETKEKALAKLAAFRPKVGYPSKFKDYEGLVIQSNTFFENMLNADKWGFDYNISQYGKPVDRERFGMTPPTVNAYYSPTMNEIVFPAGILQFPFFDPNADDAVNYGGIGAVIGHEMSHGFDDSGSKYDKDGTLRNWWTDEDRERFEERTKLLGEQFDAYTILDSIHVNGKLTMGENIGDLGGLNAAYEAFKMTKQGKSKEKIDGFTPDQRFFLAWAQVWRGSTRDETAARYIVTDPHSPIQFRTIGAPVNMDAWYEAFQVQPGEKLYKKPEDRIRIW